MNGIHWEGDIAFLLQGEKTTSAFNFEIPCPFEPSKNPCDHRIDLRAEVDPSRFPADPLVDAMSPVPQEMGNQAVFIPQPELHLILAILSRMSSPTRLPIAPFWSVRPDKIIRSLGYTNVQPLVLTGVRAKDKRFVDQVLEAAPYLPRRLVLQGEPTLVLRPEARRSTSTLGQVNLADLIALPWEAYGAHLLKQHMLSKGN
ncbi:MULTISPECIES: hypothetical protein [unclassified Mesorhizobium]|uniref:hypothetical protein n=1 Tax=unclassified Mesorhizobium TaxID=325217 RepID=UPI00112B689C|nr:MULTISPECIES: hypothetical protein [unclassified Mesorhizobium]TPJ51621.1 hypothetical protein FJ426_20530 [Mesorhizobium sp. B2-6-4]TPN42299.1 hypothetical protein FJ979_01810 [Mesorhizobium sp. B1-1-6]